MRKILCLIASLFIFTQFASAQAIVKGTGVLYTNGNPTLVATQSADAEIAIDTATGLWWEYNRDALSWSAAGFRIQLRNPCTTPTHTPGDKQSYVLLDTCDNLYRFRAGTWTQINSGGGGGATDLGYSGTSSPITITSSTGADVTVTQGGIVTVTASGSNMTISATETDGSVTNEGQLGVGAGGANTATVTTNTSGGNPVTVSGGGILAVTETTSSNGGTITLTATEVDGSTTNEGTLGVGAGGASSSTIISNTSGATGVTINVAGINAITETTSSNGGSITITGTEVDGSTTNELQTIANTSDATSHTATLSNSGGSLKLAEGSGITMATTGTSGDGVVTITASDPSPTNEIQQLTNSSDATNHYLVLDSGGSITLAEGSGITLTTTGTGDDGIVTIAATGGGGVTANNGISDNEDSGKIRLGNRYMNSPDAPFTMDRKLNLNANKFYIGDNTDSTLLQIDGTNDRVGIHTVTPGRTLSVNGEVEIKDLSTTAATVIVGADGNGVLSEITVSTGLDLTAGVLTATGGGGGSTDLSYTGTNSPITLNSSSGTDVTITEGGIVDITASGTNMTITAAEVDGSITNELQTIANTSNATSHTATLSNSGGSIQLVEGTNVTLTTTGTSGDGIVTIAATETDGSITNEGQLGVGAGGASSSTIISNTSGATGVTINVAGINAITETTSSNGGSITITATEVDGLTTNEGSLTVGAGTGSTSIINSNTSGSTGVTITAAGINTISEVGNVITLTATEVDGSISNEGILGVGAGGANTATVTTTTSTGNAVTISGGGILAVTETTSANGGTITLTATEVDGSTTNELQTVANTSDATSHTVTLSNSGGSVKLAEGSNITLTTSGTSGDGVVTIASTGTADGNGFYSGNAGNGGDGTIPSVTKSTITNQLTYYRATDDHGGFYPVRIQVDAGNEPDYMSFVTGNDSLTIFKGDTEMNIKSIPTLAITSNDVVALLGDSISVQTVPNAFDNEATLLFVAPSGSIVKAEGLDPDIIRQNSATSGQALKWNGTKWAPADDAGAGSSIYTASGTAFPNVSVAITAGNTVNFSTEGAASTAFNAGDVINDIDGDGLIVYEDGVKIGDIFGANDFYVMSGKGLNGNFIRTPASNLIQGGTNTSWDILTGTFKFTDSRATKIGLEYTADYSASILGNVRSIPDIGTVRQVYTAGTGISITNVGNNMEIAATGGSSSVANNGLSDNENGGDIRLGNRYMNSSDGLFSFDRKINTNAFKLFIGDNTDSTLLMVDGTNDKVGINTSGASRTLHVNGEVRITDLVTDNPTLLVGVDADGDLSEVTLGSGLSFTGTTLNASGGGGGDVLNNGNSFAAAFIVGSNDNNTVSLEQNGTDVVTIGTDKNITATNSVAATNTVTDQLKLNINSTGTAANSFGNGILFSGESSTTNDREMGRFRNYWTTATDASRQAAFSWMLGNNGGALTEVMKLDRSGDTEGFLSIGTTTPVQIGDNALTPNTAYTVGGNNQALTLGTLSGSLELQRQTAGTNSPLDFTLDARSSSSTANGFGVNLLFQGKATGSNNRDMGGIQTIWTTATDASRTADMVFTLTNGAAAVAEKFRVYANGRAMVGGGSNEGSAALQVNSTTGGILPPKVTTTEMNAIAGPVEGLSVYNTTEKGDFKYDGSGWHRSSMDAITGRSTAQTAAVASVATLTVGASDASYLVNGNILVTTSSAESFSLQVDYTDEGNTARTITLPIQRIATGAFVTSTISASGAVPYPSTTLQIRAKASTAITIKTSGTFTGCTYNVEGFITRIQ